MSQTDDVWIDVKKEEGERDGTSSDSTIVEIVPHEEVPVFAVFLDVRAAR